jgi:hypothetical protein
VKILRKEGKMKKILKKIIALATALMMVPAITVSAAPPVNGETGSDYWQIYKEIDVMFPGFTKDEKSVIAALAEYQLSEEKAGRDFGTVFLPEVERVCKDWQDAGYERVLVAYSVVFGGVSRDWCVSMGADAAELDFLMIELGGNPSVSNASAPAASQTGSAPVWKQDGKGWWIENPDGSYLMNQWYQSPESGLWYYMGSDGYMLTNTTTPDGCMVNADGVWVQ